MGSATAITNLLYRYAELMDAGRLEEVAAMFSHARVTLGGGRVVEGSAAMLEQWRAFVRIHPCGTPRTRHVITNPIVEIDEAAGWASCRSVYTVFQQAPELPLQAIASGRYHDTFECVDGAWRFATRDYSMLDYIGDLSQHLLLPVG
ncbi:nuclear transport factor 2 family protein [Novosphingobium taihuense]|uniref:3-phenylpropionate/cinnamic acid dioxygenase small subunit n=1 Tax=Novosphingobium taihuense TaxID=260085 RepID=A0A7W7EUD0_9SPHN|nr:nuclear transport factor 2 family protein [Novosphingobium taihuense]MBB4613924.1 3-phenylpropionate/cinnamic acid dioxygenase small subunit [Novosphingobium taihuense]TWH86775.1 3-phenylpropionate/cinnamic acid dioxygenase small subunit [Novosphingobium taihuense]